MKTLQIFFLVLAISFGYSDSATTNFSNSYFPETVKGGFPTAQKLNSAMVAVIAVEGTYEYYLQHLKFNLNYKKDGEKKGIERERVSASCAWIPGI